MNIVVPSNEEFIYEGKVAISQTDLNGNLTYVNRKFCEISGYTRKELIGSSHNIIKDSSVPEATFDKMWEVLQNGRVWNGMLKNLRKDGRYYWVDIEISPIFNTNEEITGYISVSKPPSRKNITESEKQYQKTNSTK